MRIGPSRHVSMDEAHLGSIRTKYVLKPCNLNQDRDNRTPAVPTEPTECSPVHVVLLLLMTVVVLVLEAPLVWYLGETQRHWQVAWLLGRAWLLGEPDHGQCRWWLLCALA